MLPPKAFNYHDDPTLRADVLSPDYVDACTTLYRNREAFELAKSLPEGDLLTITPSSMAGSYKCNQTVLRVGLVDSLPAAERDRVTTVLETEGLGHVTDIAYGQQLADDGD